MVKTLILNSSSFLPPINQILQKGYVDSRVCWFFISYLVTEKIVLKRKFLFFGFAMYSLFPYDFWMGVLEFVSVDEINHCMYIDNLYLHPS